MNTEQILAHLARHNVKPTANRILIAEAISQYNGPVSMKELETKLQTIDKSSTLYTRWKTATILFATSFA